MLEETNNIILKEKLSYHACARLAERNLTLQHIKLVLSWGHTEYRSGLCFYLLRRCDLPKEIYKEHQHLIGVVVITDQEGTIVTCYRANPRKLHFIYKLRKYRKPNNLQSHSSYLLA